jgi:hypothetical protein
MMGAVWLLWGSLFLIGNSLPTGPRQFYWMFSTLILVGSGVVMNWATRKLKERITYPRAGYVALNEPAPLVRIGRILLAMGVAALVALLAARGRVMDREQEVTVGIGLLLTAAFLILSARMRTPHMLWLSGASLAFTVWLYRTSARLEQLNWLFVWLGAASMLLGAVRLHGFLKANPKPIGNGNE